MNQSLPTGRVTLDQLIALSDEMAALVRSGVPLERGLVNLGQDVPGQLGRLAKELGQRLERGESLSSVLAQGNTPFPSVFRAVVESGMRSGRLAAALEGLATGARRLAELRKTIGFAMLYPLAVTLLAYGVFVFYVARLAPEYQAAYDGFRVERHALLEFMVSLGDSVWLWGPLLPAVVLISSALWWWRTGRSLMVHNSASALLLGWIPGVRRMVSDSRTAMFAEMLALLAEHDVPLPEAVRLAAETTGDRRTVQSAQKIAEAIRSGQPLSEALPACPPVLAWLLSTGSEQLLLCSAARHTAEHYAWRAKYRFEIVQLLLPIIATAVVAGVVTLSYALTLYVPWTNLLQSLH